MKNFESYTIEDKKIKSKAGVVIILNDKLLVVHHTNSSWNKRTLSIPKGTIEPFETEKEAAFRELYEEVGISIPENKIPLSPESITIYSGNKPTSILSYYAVYINSLEEIGLTSEVIPKHMLQLKEVDWAGFIPKSLAYEKLIQSQLIILDRHL